MPFDSNGTFNRVIVGGWQADAAAGTKITAVRHDAEDDGFASGLSTCLTKDGRTQPTANIPMNNKKITNLGEPTGISDAATKNYVDTFKAFGTGLNISGAGPINGFIQFVAPTGINGIGWTTADMSWIGRLEEASKTRKRLAVNDKNDGSGTDVVTVDEGGFINSTGYISNNLSYDGAWRTIVAGTGNYLRYTGSSLALLSNDTATTSAYQTATMHQYFTASNSTGAASVTLNKTGVVAGASKTADIFGQRDSLARWLVRLGNGTAETATDRVGSDFEIYSYNNAGAVPTRELLIDRDTHQWTIGGPLAGSGGVRVRPSSVTTATDPQDLVLDGNGTLLVCEGSNGAVTGGTYAGLGIRGRTGHTGSYDTLWMNSHWDGANLTMYANASPLGWVAWGCDYRIKKDVQPLPSTWDAVKQLRPISYTQKAYDIWIDDDQVRWGFMAHELQEKLTQSAASGSKDGPDVQGPNWAVVIAALTKALQEAMERIEALEAAA